MMPAAVRSCCSALLWSGVRRAISTPLGLRAVNGLHRRLGAAARRRFYYLCFDETCGVEGAWTVDFAGRRLVLPLHRDFPLGWVFAIGFDGYDPEIHALYEALVRGPRPPRVFFDVGASYGLHSLRFLAHGIRAVSFEPNPACHAFLLECCARNRLVPEIHAVAVGARNATVELAVPGHQTYLGTVVDTVKSAWHDRPDVVLRTVPQVTLDGFAEAHGILPDLVKIDAEGSELAILEGAQAVLEQARPLVVLESWPDAEQRSRLFERLAGHHYGLAALSCAPDAGRALGRSAFLSSPAVNFLARPVP
jgi:FkbM family methyltransferase